MTTSRSMWQIAVILSITISAAGCAGRSVQSSKMIYETARAAQETGDDFKATLYWKELVQRASRDIERGKLLNTNHFIRASAYVELGEWDTAKADLQQIDLATLRKEEYWVFPLYAILMGDYYSQQGLYTIAENFYQSVLKESSFRSSSVYIFALERHINNALRQINETDAEKKEKEYAQLVKEVQKFVEDNPFSGVAHFLLGDLQLKSGQPEEALQHLIASFDLGLPTRDLHRSAEFQIAQLLSNFTVSKGLKSALLRKAVALWGTARSESILMGGENTYEWIAEHGVAVDAPDLKGTTIRFLAVQTEGKLRIVAWEKK